MSYDLYVVRPDIPEDCGQYGCPEPRNSFWIIGWAVAIRRTRHGQAVRRSHA